MTEQELADLLREHASAHRVPGATIGVRRDDEEMFARYGVANTRTGAAVTAQSRFSVGSLTKSMVATVVARLADDRRLSLEDPVAAYVPELRAATWAEHATVRDLLGNRSGLPLRVRLEFEYAAHDDEAEDVLSRFAATMGAEEPTPIDWSYTNAGWCVLGRAIETVTGAPWEEAMRAELIAPTGMRETTFATESHSGARVSGHELTADGAVTVEPLVSRAYGPAGTSVVSTVGDLLRFAALHLDDPALATLRRPQPAPRIHGWLDGWCLGWGWFDWEGNRVWGWDSVINGERAVLRLVPERDAAVVLTANSNTGRALYRSLFADLIHSLLDIRAPPLSLDARAGAAGDLTRFAGIYAWPDRRVEVTAAETCLLIKSERGGTEALPLDERTFVVDSMDPDNPTVTFGAFDAAGRPHVLYMMLWGLPRLDDESNANPQDD
ncbi:MAG: beta-lactamase family protein [Chloroflexota bacterium]|nr:beta-lactamase family protein [Chloroflexota bacterium]